MSAINFIKQHGVDKARKVVEGAPAFPVFGYCTVTGSYIFKRANATAYYHNETNSWSEEYAIDLILLEDLKRLVESVDLINSVGGLTIANKITFQKRLRNEKATHFIQHPENQKLIQLFGRNQRKPEAAIKFDLFEQAIADYESIYGGEHV